MPQKNNGNSLSAKQTTTHNLLPKKNTGTMIPPARRPPADPIFKVSDIAVHRAIEHHLRYTAMHFFLRATNFIFILLAIILQKAAQRAR